MPIQPDPRPDCGINAWKGRVKQEYQEHVIPEQRKLLVAREAWDHNKDKKQEEQKETRKISPQKEKVIILRTNYQGRYLFATCFIRWK